jgi:hypothetical protein
VDVAVPASTIKTGAARMSLIRLIYRPWRMGVGRSGIAGFGVLGCNRATCPASRRAYRFGGRGRNKLGQNGDK